MTTWATVLTAQTNQHACAGSECQLWQQCFKTEHVLTGWGLFDILLTGQSARLSWEAHHHGNQEHRETELQEGRRNTEEVASSVIFSDSFRVICRHDSLENNPLLRYDFLPETLPWFKIGENKDNTHLTFSVIWHQLHSFWKNPAKCRIWLRNHG